MGTQYLLALRLLNLPTSGFYTHHPIYHKGWTQGGNPVPTSLEVTESTYIRFLHISSYISQRMGTQYLLALRFGESDSSSLHTPHGIYHKGWNQGLNPVTTSLRFGESDSSSLHTPHDIYYKGWNQGGNPVS